jgi:hypothetical protein
MTLPPFLYGCFDWRVNGLHWADTPPLDLLSRTALESPNPWIVLASVVEHAKAGDHSQAPRLIQFFRQHDPFALSRVSLLVFADLAPSTELPQLETVLRGDDVDSRAYAAEAAALAGSLALVPAMLDAWVRAETVGDHETIGFAISDMLEDPIGPIGEHVGIYNVTHSNSPPLTPNQERLLAMRAEYEARRGPPPLPGLVRAEHQRLVNELGDEAFVWAGAALDVNRFVERFLAESKDPEPPSFINLRHRFEAWTGEPCQDFFRAFAPQRLEITASLEDFVRAGKGKRYRPGVRYFFGHPIP